MRAHAPAPAKTNPTLGLLLMVAAAPSIGALSALWLWPGSVGSTIYALCKVVLYGIPAIVAWCTLTRADIREGIRRGLRTAPILYAIVSGLVIGGGILLLWFTLLAERSDTVKLVDVVTETGLDQQLRYWAFAAWLCIGNSLLEEFVFRWFIDSRLRILGVPPIFALGLSAAIFTMHHVIVLAAFFDPPLVILGSAGVFVGGVIWSWSLRHWQSLLPAWISHALIDVAIFLVGASILGIGP